MSISSVSDISDSSDENRIQVAGLCGKSVENNMLPKLPKGLNENEIKVCELIS